MAEEPNFEEMFKRQRQALEAEKAEQEQQLKAIQESLAKIVQKLERLNAIMRLFNEPTIEKEHRPKLTIKEAVLQILENSPRGLPALSILERLRTTFDMDYPRTSLSPQLSRLKAEGKIGLGGSIWYLIRNENGPGA